MLRNAHRRTAVAAMAATACGGMVAEPAAGPEAGAADAGGTTLRDVSAQADVVEEDAGAWSFGFGPTVTVPLNDLSFIASVDAADVTNDGRVDVLVTGMRTAGATQVAGLYVLPQTSMGTLGPPVWYPFDPADHVVLGGLAIGDVTGDGRNDVVVTPENGLAVLAQDDAGALSSPHVYADLSVFFDDSMALGHFGADSLVGAVQGSKFSSASVRVWVQATGALSYSAGFPPADSDLMAAGDVTGDGKDDAVVTHSAQGAVTVVPQSGPAKLGSPVDYPLPGSFSVAGGLAIGDVTGDGLADVVVAHGGDPQNTRLVVLAQQSGSLASPVLHDSLDNPSTVRLADMNGDGRLDAVVAHEGYGQVGVYLQTASGTFLAEQLFAFDSGTGTRGKQIGVGDLDGDGHPDVVGIPSSGAGILLLLSK